MELHQLSVDQKIENLLITKERIQQKKEELDKQLKGIEKQISRLKIVRSKPPSSTNSSLSQEINRFSSARAAADLLR
jgi:septal ring factor EnvC (AmiA/AmiB activator)